MIDCIVPRSIVFVPVSVIVASIVFYVAWWKQILVLSICGVLFKNSKSILSIIRRALFPEFFKDRHIGVPIVVDFLRATPTPYAVDILRELAVEGNGECKEENIKIGDVSTFAENLSSRDQNSGSTPFDFLKGEGTLSRRIFYQ